MVLYVVEVVTSGGNIAGGTGENIAGGSTHKKLSYIFLSKSFSGMLELGMADEIAVSQCNVKQSVGMD